MKVLKTLNYLSFKMFKVQGMKVPNLPYYSAQNGQLKGVLVGIKSGYRDKHKLNQVI